MNLSVPGFFHKFPLPLFYHSDEKYRHKADRSTHLGCTVPQSGTTPASQRDHSHTDVQYDSGPSNKAVSYFPGLLCHSRIRFSRYLHRLVHRASHHSNEKRSIAGKVKGLYAVKTQNLS